MSDGRARRSTDLIEGVHKLEVASNVFLADFRDREEHGAVNHVENLRGVSTERPLIS